MRGERGEAGLCPGEVALLWAARGICRHLREVMVIYRRREVRGQVLLAGILLQLQGVLALSGHRRARALQVRRKAAAVRRHLHGEVLLAEDRPVEALPDAQAEAEAREAEVQEESESDGCIAAYMGAVCDR